MLGSRLDFSHERNLNVDELLRRLEAEKPDANINLVRKAYIFAEKAHEGQKRSSGEEYIIHPLNVAGTLVKLRMDEDSIIAGLLHDTIEDCDVTKDQIEAEFGPKIAEIVLGLTKISKIKFKTKEENQAENFRKMVVAMAKDLRVIIVKLADRMHNMRTLQYVSEAKQHKVAQETLDIYVPLASRLGINSIKSELEDLCLRFIHPEIYYRLAEKVAMKRSERDKYIGETVDVISEKLLEYSVKAEVKGRPKHFYSIYKKMESRGVDFDQIQDILAFRVVVSNITECYKALGIIHSSFTPIPGRFKDYIAIPKVNNYQSLHTTVVGPKAERIEIQIRTYEMHEVAEKGIAAHWKYKEGIKGGKTEALNWVQDLLEINQDVESNQEFMNVVKSDLDIGGIFVFTPDGDVRELKHGCTPLDFAYAIHTEVGHRCVGAKINGKMVPLKYRLKSGDTAEILTSKTQTPSKDWLNIVRSSRAKAKIKQWLLKVERDRNQKLGEEVLDKALKLVKVNRNNFLKSSDLDIVLKKFKARSYDELAQHVGAGKYTAKEVVEAIPGVQEEQPDHPPIQEINSYYQKLANTAKKTSRRDNAVLVDGLEDVQVRMAKCCNPIPGDSVTGFITRGRGITVHRQDCSRIDEGDLARRIEVQWNSQYTFKHPVSVRAITNDRPGILSTISKNINNAGINIRSAIAKSLPDQKGSFIFEVEVKDFRELLKVISTIESVEDVISVSRV